VPTQTGPRPAQPPAEKLPGLSPDVKRQGRGVDHQPISKAKAMNGLELNLRFSSVSAQACHGVTTFSFVA